MTGLLFEGHKRAFVPGLRSESEQSPSPKTTAVARTSLGPEDTVTKTKNMAVQPRVSNWIAVTESQPSEYVPILTNGPNDPLGFVW